MLRLRRRISSLGLEVRTVRARGYLLQQVEGDQPARLTVVVTTPAMLASWVLGLILAFSGAIDWSRDGWFHSKLILVVALSAYSGLLAMWTKDFALDRNRRSASFYRIANEVPTLLMIVIVILRSSGLSKGRRQDYSYRLRGLL